MKTDKCEYLTQRELCEVLGIDTRTFSRERIGEKFTPYKIGKRIKYRKSDIERLRIDTKRWGQTPK